MGLFDMFRREPTIRVEMIVSAAEYVAGIAYDLPVEIADRFIARGYARGEYSRTYDEHELSALRGNDHQSVSIVG
jgi:hypothetical protein